MMRSHFTGSTALTIAAVPVRAESVASWIYIGTHHLLLQNIALVSALGIYGKIELDQYFICGVIRFLM